VSPSDETTARGVGAGEALATQTVGHRGEQPRSDKHDRGGHRVVRDLIDEMNALIAGLDLDPNQQRFMEYRWRDQTAFFRGRVQENRKYFYWLRMVAVVGAVTVPALVGLNVAGSAARGVKWSAFGLSLLVAIVTAWEQLFRFGQRWRLYRQALDAMRAEAWRFAQLLPPYSGKKHGEPDNAHRSLFPLFAEKVEAIVKEFGEEYVEDVVVPARGAPREDGTKEPPPHT